VLARVVKVSPSIHCRAISRRLQAGDFQHPTTYIIFNFTPAFWFPPKDVCYSLLLFHQHVNEHLCSASLLNGLSGRQFLAGHQVRALVIKLYALSIKL
jgi:hypothetical protein